MRQSMHALRFAPGHAARALLMAAVIAGSLPPALCAADELLMADRVAELKRARAATLAKAAALGLPVDVRSADGKRVLLHRFVGNRPLYYSPTNADAADTVSTDEVRSGGSLGLNLDGSGQTLGIWDVGEVRDTHQEFGTQVTNLDLVGLSNHATHVAGTMIGAGIDTTARGMAPAATLRVRDFEEDLAEMIEAQNGPDPVVVSNHSYAMLSGWRYNAFNDGLWAWYGEADLDPADDVVFGFYGEDAQGFDELAHNASDYLIVVAAGNDRDDAGPGSGAHWHFDSSTAEFVMSSDTHPPDGGASGYDTIAGGAGSAKNILTIGAVYDIAGGYSAPDDVSMTTFSGWGPTDDGRIKPDLVANGIGLLSAAAASDTAYASLSGTSRSTPNVTGSLALLRQHAVSLYGQPLRSATLRALALHSADDAGNTGPDYSYGWGLLNTASAAQIISNDATGVPSDEIHELTLNNGETLSVHFSATEAGVVRVTAAWTDPPGTPPAPSVDPPDLMLVNDIDIRLVDDGGVTHEPWILDPAAPAAAATTGDNYRDPIEQIVTGPVRPGAYRLDISHKSTLHKAQPQPLSVIISRPCCSTDTDADNVANDLDNCPLVANPGQQNSDTDSHGDACDNCPSVSNEDQCNTNAPDADDGDLGDDNLGNRCDADLDNNGVVNTFDLNLLRTQFGLGGSQDADLDCNGVVNSFDIAEMRASFGEPGASRPR